ncbi:hypothetical protein CGLO_10151 [Colletotrichum gloeosporioides Cg-14]|uniref:Uncharacterized protein n=1 Tax=Colletotrichum gloeosporioides (strain Cg-14) TaxID=1237896 RepID=T0LQE2_COLGC|nr:hypothetical protein CGLO_10151 [Colletotrichum gloeosporioides Cg-14]
MDVNQFFFR